MPAPRTPRWLLAAALLVAVLLSLAAAPRPALADAAEPPNGMIVWLQIRTPKTDVTCTGFMVGPHTIATAAHCLYNPEFGGWASSAFVTPGIDGLNAPFGTEWATSFDVSPSWVQTLRLNADYGVITLGSDALGTATGWFDVSTPSDSELGTGVFASAGYGTSGQYGTLWRMPRPQLLADYDEDFLAYNWGTTTGESGAPIFDPVPAGRYRAVGLIKGAFTSPGERAEFGLRMTADMVRFYRDRASGPPAAPVQQTIPTLFTGAVGVPVRISSPVTRANTPSVLQSSADQVTWTTVAAASTDARGVATYTVTPADTRYYRVVVQGIGTGRVGRGFVTPAPTSGPGGGGFASAPAYSSSRVALAVFQGGSVEDLNVALVNAGARAAWVQTAAGEWRLYVAGGTFVNDAFLDAFPAGFATATPMTLVGA